MTPKEFILQIAPNKKQDKSLSLTGDLQASKQKERYLHATTTNEKQRPFLFLKIFNRPPFFHSPRERERESEREKVEMQSLQEKASAWSGVDQADAFAIDESNLFEKLGLQSFINLSTNFYTRFLTKSPLCVLSLDYNWGTVTSSYYRTKVHCLLCVLLWKSLLLYSLRDFFG